MKKKFLLGLIVIFLVSFFSEVFLFNFNFFRLKDNERGIILIKDYDEKISNDSKVISINLNKMYVSKLIVDYHVSNDVPVTLKYEKKDFYNKYEEAVINDILEKEVDKQVTNFNNKLKKIDINYDADMNVKVNSIKIDNRIHINWIRILFVFVSISMFSFLGYSYYKKIINKKNIHLYFFWIGFVLGCCIIICQPSSTYYSWDDQIHFKNMLELRGGNIEWTNGEASMIASNAIRDSVGSLEEKIQQDRYFENGTDQKYQGYSGRFLTYNKIAYIPSALGYYLGKIINLPFFICFKIGKIFNLVAYLLIMAYAIKIASVSKNLLVVIGLIPGNVFLASQYSYDPAVTSGLTLGLVILINWFVDKNFKIDFKNFLIFLLSMLYGSFPKAVYIPLILLFLLLPKDKFKNEKQCRQLKMGVLIICFLVSITFVLPAVSNSAEADFRGGDTSVSRQLHNILNFPFGYVSVLRETLVKSFGSYFIGDALVSYSYIGNVSKNLYYLYLILFLFVSFTDTNKKELKLFQRISLLVLILGINLLIWTALYLSFTPVGFNSINGVQPRYFLPLLFPLVMCFNTSAIKSNIREDIYHIATLAIPAIIILLSVYELILSVYSI